MNQHKPCRKQRATFVYVFEKNIKCPSSQHITKDYNKPTNNTDAEQHFGCHNITGCCCSISWHKNIVNKIVDKKIDGFVHAQFQKFSRGEFKNRAVVKVKNSKGKYTINTSAEFANELVKSVAEKLGESRAQVTGAIVSTGDLTGELDFKEKKQFQGVKRYLIEKEMSGNEILKIMEKFPKAFFALSFETEKDETDRKSVV